MSDPDIERLQDEIYASRIKPWDVEAFLAERHRAKFKILTEPKSARESGWQVAKEIATAILAFIGYLTVCAALGYWLIIP